MKPFLGCEIGSEWLDNFVEESAAEGDVWRLGFWSIMIQMGDLTSPMRVLAVGLP